MAKQTTVKTKARLSKRYDDEIRTTLQKNLAVIDQAISERRTAELSWP